MSDAIKSAVTHYTVTGEVHRATGAAAGAIPRLPAPVPFRARRHEHYQLASVPAGAR